MTVVMNNALKARLAALRLVSFDCDGVMTDGGLFYAADGSELRRFNVRDGLGIKMLMAAGVEVAFISASKTSAIVHRAKALGVNHCLVGAEDKIAVLEELCSRIDVPFERVAHVGDDLNDIPLLKVVGVPITVADAVEDVRVLAHYVSHRKGGDAAVREIADLILAARGPKR